MIAGTHKTSESVGTVAVFAKIFVFFTFVDVFQYYCDCVRPITHTTRTKFLIF